ncbi:MAG: ATP-dependent DNA helicase [bacterium]|nr:ATP-dependent DNA helicase [bacterium]
MQLTERDILSGLNPKQLEAVTFGEGPLLIIAGAGTGKTKVITHRIAWLIVSKRARPEEILGLTFTDKAADEMEERVDVLVPYGYIPVQISTFHSFGQRILREYAFELGISPNFKVLTTPELLVFLKEHLWELPLEHFRPLSYPTKYLESLLAVISRAKDEDVTSEEYFNYATDRVAKSNSAEDKDEAIKQLEVAKCYQKYEELLTTAGYLDIPSLITLPLKLLRTSPSSLKKLQARFKYILVDEFQDTNYAQFQLLQLLAAPHRNITVVGDDDQSIYKFRGACLANILSFRDIYPDAYEIVLTQNYRSTQSILSTAHRLISFNNPNRLEIISKVDKSIVGIKPIGTKVSYFHYDTISNEADSVAGIIEDKVKHGFKYSDFAILVRTNQTAIPFLASLNLHGIPYRFSGNQGLYDREEIKILISLLNVLSNVGDDQSIYHLLISPVYNLNPIELSKCFGVARRNNRSLYEGLTDLIDKSKQRSRGEAGVPYNSEIDISTASKSIIEMFLKEIAHLSHLATTQSTGKVLYEFLTNSSWFKSLVSNPSIENEITIKNIAHFLRIIENVGSLIRTDRVPFVAAHIESLRDLGDNPPVAEADFDIDAVNVMTVHKAKGLEFRVVFLTSLVSDIFPHREMPKLAELPLVLVKEQIPDIPDSEVHEQEERRLFYVGMTRAKDELILTSSRDYGGRRAKRVSQFVIEAMDLQKTEIVAEKEMDLEKIAHFGRVTEPKLEKIDRAAILELSSTGIDDWLTCPRKYWYIHYLKVPTPKHHTIVYGVAVHKAIEFYLSSKKLGKQTTPHEVIRVFKDSWVSEGFVSRKHEEDRFKKGEEVISKFFIEEEKNGVIPTFVEEEFSFLLDDVRVIGKWDRVNDDVIIDYKTGDVFTKSKANKRARDSVQLPIYGLAYLERFGKLPSRIELHFVDTGVVGELKNVSEKIKKVKQIINDVAHRIRARDFLPNPTYRACEFCTCRMLCSYIP